MSAASERTGSSAERRADEPDSRDEQRLLQQRWHGWGSPVGLGVGLLSVGGFFTLLSLGLSILSSIG